VDQRLNNETGILPYEAKIGSDACNARRGMSPVLEMTVIIPSYNEANGLKQVLPTLIETCRKHGWRILVVDDASSDATVDVLDRFEGEIEVIRNWTNIGYGASIKKGIIAAETDWVATFDSDGQHRAEDLEKLAAEIGFYDAVVGKRNLESHCSFSRMPGKWVLGKIANLLVGAKIPDINCGLRIFRRRAILEILRLTSDSFSFSTSSLIALIKMGYNVYLSPVTINRRIGNSSVHQVKDGLNTILLILRLITLFDPFRIMLPFSAFFFTVGLIYQLTSFAVYGFDLNKLTVLLWIFSIIIFLVALVADQIGALRREISKYILSHHYKSDEKRL